MIRYASPPAVRVDIGRYGVTWEKFSMAMEIDSDHTARFIRVPLEAGGGATLSEPSTFTGTVTSLQPGKSMSIEIPLGNDDHHRFVLVAGTGELVGEFYSGFADSRNGIILIPETDGPLFPEPLDGARPVSPLGDPVMTLAPGSPPAGDEFKRAWSRLNRHLRYHGGRSATLRLGDLGAEQRRFVEELAAGPLAALEHDALMQLRDFRADAKKRISVNVTSLVLPYEPDQSAPDWEITLGEASLGGIVVVYSLVGWSVVDRTLVG